MSIRNIDWIDGAPEKLEPGMIIHGEDDHFFLIGHFDDSYGCAIDPAFLDGLDEDIAAIKRWGWLVQPHELEWLADMATRSGKGRPEE